MRPRRRATGRGSDRRSFLHAAAALGGLSALGTAGAIGDDAPEGGAHRAGPGLPHPDRVVEVRHPGSCPGGTPDADAVRRMVRRGIAALTGIDEPAEAWRSLFRKGEVVGIKVNPVGAPRAISNYATVHALIEGLESAGVRRRDVVVFEPGRSTFRRADSALG